MSGWLSITNEGVTMKQKFKFPVLGTGVLVGALCAVALPAQADNSAMIELLKVLRDKGTLSESDYQMLKNASGTEAEKERAELVTAKEEMKEEAKKEIAAEEKFTVKTGTKGLTVISKDGNFKFGVGGRMQADTAFFFPNMPYGNGAEIRRVRLKGYGTIYHDWKYKVEIDFADGAELTDGWLAYTGFKPLVLKVGHQKVPFSLQSLTSSNWQVFQERALTDAFIDNGESGRRRLGITGLLGGDLFGNDYWTFGTGFFGQGANDDGAFNESWGVAARATYAPIANLDDRELVAFGGSVYYRDLNAHSDLRIRARPEAHISGVRLVDTGVIETANNFRLANAEFTTLWGPWHAQAEYYNERVSRSNGLSALNFNGFYVQTGFFLTGESRHYNKKYASYKRVKPFNPVGLGGWGAWEIAARYSYMDLASNNNFGGLERDFTFGLNWWATDNVMFRFNYVNAKAFPASLRTPGLGLGRNPSVNILEGRAQVVF